MVCTIQKVKNELSGDCNLRSGWRPPSAICCYYWQLSPVLSTWVGSLPSQKAQLGAACGSTVAATKGKEVSLFTFPLRFSLSPTQDWFWKHSPCRLDPVATFHGGGWMATSISKGFVLWPLLVSAARASLPSLFPDRGMLGLTQPRYLTHAGIHHIRIIHLLMSHWDDYMSMGMMSSSYLL